MQIDKLISRLQEIYEIYQEHKSHYQSSETATRDQLINPILNELGWNTASPKFVRPNQRDDAGFIPDYALFKEGKKLLIVEAKKTSVAIDNNAKSISQLIRYVYEDGLEFGILTNGVRWLLFDTFTRNVSDRVVWIVDITASQTNFAEEAHKLATLAYENIERLHEHTQALKEEQALSAFWVEHLQSEEGRLRFLAESIGQRFPNIALERILAFLSEQINMPPIQQASPSTAPIVAEKRTRRNTTERSRNIIPTKKSKTRGVTKSGRPYAPKSPKSNIRVVFPDGTTIQNKQASETLAQAIEKIGAERVSQLGLRQTGHLFVSKERSTTVNQYEAGGGYWVVVHSSTKDKIKQLETVSKALGLGLRVESVAAQ